MLKGNLLHETIVEDTDNFSLKGMIRPMLYNFGTVDVKILYRTIEPGGVFDAGAEGVIMQNGIPIRFLEGEKHERNVTCYYVREVNESNC